MASWAATENRTYDHRVSNGTQVNRAFISTPCKLGRFSDFCSSGMSIWVPLSLAVLFLMLMMIGATAVLRYGSNNIMNAIILCSPLVLLMAIPTAYNVPMAEVYTGLMIRGAAVGSLLSTIWSPVCRRRIFIFFMIHAVIIALWLQPATGKSLLIGDLLGALVTLSLVVKGMMSISRLQTSKEPMRPSSFGVILPQAVAAVEMWQNYQKCKTPGFSERRLNAVNDKSVHRWIFLRSLAQ